MTLAISPLTKARAQHLLSYLLVSLVPIMICGILLIGNTYSQHTDQEDQAAYNGLHMFSSTYSRLMSSMDSCAGHFEDSYPIIFNKVKPQYALRLLHIKRIMRHLLTFSITCAAAITYIQVKASLTIMRLSWNLCLITTSTLICRNYSPI